MIEDYDECPVHDRRHHVKKRLPANVHLMNKNESKMLRKLKMQTGLSEKELRSMKKYRKVLSYAQDIGEKPVSWDIKREKYYKALRRSVINSTEMSPWHPDLEKAIQQEIQNRKSRGRHPWYML